MKTLTALVVGLCLVTVASADVALMDDFESYNLGTINGQGTWQCQDNTDWTVSDHNHSNVVTDGGNQILSLVNRDADENIDTVFTSSPIPAITSTGTIYLKWKADGPNDTLITTNGLEPGWYEDGEGHLDTSIGQGTANYGDQASLSRLAADQFRAYDGGYANVAPTFAADTWYEMWIHIDMTAQASRYYVTEVGGTPQVVLNASGGEWWGNRNTGYSQFSNIKFFAGMYPWPDNNIQTEVLIDDIGVDDCGYSLNAVPEPATMSLLALGGLALIRRRR